MKYRKGPINLEKQVLNKAIAMMRRKSPPTENIYFIENQTNISKGIHGKDFITFS